MSSRNWCFTISKEHMNSSNLIWVNTKEEDEIFPESGFGRIVKILEALYQQGKITRAVIGDEVGENGYEHGQGYIQFVNVRKQKFLKDMMPKAHLEIMRGTPCEAWDYCCKDGQYAAIGERPVGQGARKDLTEIKEMALEGASRRELYDASANFQAFRFAEVGRQMSFVKRDWKPHVEWHYGPTGIGKSRYAHGQMPDAFVCVVDAVVNGFYFGGYDGEPDVIFDEFRGSAMKMSLLLAILDRYPLTVRTIGGSMQFQGKRIIITSHESPEKAYCNAGEALGQLLRRIDVIHNWNDGNFVTQSHIPH